jgi:hypothetical protein
MMQHCQFCGSAFPDHARFCGNCGREATSNKVLDSPPPPYASDPEATMRILAITPLPLGNRPAGEDEEEERRRSAPLPRPIPPWAAGSLAGWQVPLVQGTPSLNGVPSVQGTAPEIAGSVPLSHIAGSAAGNGAGGVEAEEPVALEQHVYARTDPQVAHHDGSTGLQSHELPEQEHQGKQLHHHEIQAPHGRYAVGAASKAAISGTTKWILLTIIGLLVVAGSASALVFVSRSHSSGPGNTTPASSSKSTPISSNQNASATACASSPGVPCSGTVSPASPVASGQPTGTFTFAGADSGPMTITSFLVCGLLGNSYGMHVIGTVGGTQYDFIIGILSYSGPGTYASHLIVELLVHTGVNASALTNDGSLPVSITITNGGKAGTVSSDLEGIVNGSQFSTGHVSGSWTAC